MSVFMDEEVDTTIALNETTNIRYKIEQFPAHVSHIFFLFVDGKAVSYLKLMELSYETGLVICDIETREGEKRKGYANLVRKTAVELTGKELLSTGGFTPEGFAAFYGKNPVYSAGHDYGCATYKPMTFINDWDGIWQDVPEG